MSDDPLERRRPWFVDALLRAGWAPLAVFVVHLLASRPHGLYRTWPSFDIPMHLAGGVSIAFLFWRAVTLASRTALLGTLNRLGQSVLVFSLTCSAAVFWEFAEFLSDRWFHTGAQSGLQDTLGDMFFGIAGGVVFLIAAATRKVK